MILVDVNVVLAVHREDHPHHEATRGWFDALTDGEDQFGVPDVVWAAFIRISTSPKIFEVPTPVDDAFAFLRAVRAQPNHLAIAPAERHLALFEDLCRTSDAKGDLVPDAYVAAIAKEQGATVASFDRDFARFEGLDWIVPRATA